MTCCGPNRRRLLAGLAAAAAVPLAVPSSARAQANSLRATDLEVITLTDTSAIITWTTLAADASGAPVPVEAGTEIRLAPADSAGPARTVPLAGADRTPYHYAQIEGLEPGRRYRFEAWSDGVRAVPAPELVTHLPGAPESSGEFTTL